MYSKHEASLLRQQFWTAFGQYMLPVLSADGEKINWVNYKTGQKHIRFTMQVENKTATIAVELNNPDLNAQEEALETFTQFKNALSDEWIWQKHLMTENNKNISRIYKELPGINIMTKEDWPALISFFKINIIELDDFWSNYKFAFEL